MINENNVQGAMTSALIQATNVLAKSAIEDSARTLTIEAKIIDVKDQGRGIYRIQYYDNVYEANSLNLENIFQINDIVYVLVPDADFSKTKVILSTISSEKIQEFSTEGDLYIPIGDNILLIDGNVNLCSFKTEEKPAISSIQSAVVDLFDNALQDTQTFNLTCKIQTNIESSRRSRGNYGLKLTFPVWIEGNEDTYTITMDINNILGDAYNFQTPALQNLYFTLPSNIIFNNLRNAASRIKLTAFIKDFPDQWDGTEPEPADDVFITNIQLLPVKVITQNNKKGYYFNLTATEGSCFWLSGFSEKTLIPKLYLNGRETLLNGFDFYWFVENASIGTTSEDFFHYGGIGWELLNEKEEIKETDTGQSYSEPTKNISTWTIKRSDVHTNLRYKCVIVQGERIFSDIITIRNLLSPAELVLTTSTGSTTYIENIGSVDLIMKYYEEDLFDESGKCLWTINYNWERLNKDNTPISFEPYINEDTAFYDYIEGDIKKEEIDGKNYIVKHIEVPISKIDDFNTIKCTVERSKTVVDAGVEKRITQKVGTESIVISTQAKPAYRLVVENANVLYKYDPNGYSPFVANYDGAVSTLKAITPLSVRAYKDNGEEFTKDEYNASTIEWKIPKPAHSLIITDTSLPDLNSNIDENYYIISGNYIDHKTFPYTIQSLYDKSKSDNSILITLTFSDDIVVQTSANIQFLKEGESGTNGSKYSALICYDREGYDVGYAYEEKDGEGNIHKLQFIYVANGSAAEKGWYFYDPGCKDYPQPVKLTDETPSKYRTLNTKVFCDSQEIEYTFRDTNKEVKWYIFDYQNKNDYGIFSPIAIDETLGLFSIATVTEEIEGEQVTREIAWTSTVDSFCATIQAEIIAKKNSIDETSNDFLMNQEKIYAYYPIEVTRVENISVMNEVVPHVVGGFSYVLYDSTGHKPMFDSSKPFQLLDNQIATKEAMEETNINIVDDKYKFTTDYQWSIGGNARPLLKIIDIDDNDSRLCTIEPETEFDELNSKQAVRVEYTYCIDSASTEDVKGDLRCDIHNDEESERYYKDLLFYYNNINEGINTTLIANWQICKSVILNLCYEQDSEIYIKNDGINILNTLYNSIVELKTNYLKYDDPDPDASYLLKINNIIERLETLLYYFKELGDRYDNNDLIDEFSKAIYNANNMSLGTDPKPLDTTKKQRNYEAYLESWQKYNIYFVEYLSLRTRVLDGSAGTATTEQKLREVKNRIETFLILPEYDQTAPPYTDNYDKKLQGWQALLLSKFPVEDASIENTIKDYEFWNEWHSSSDIVREWVPKEVKELHDTLLPLYNDLVKIKEDAFKNVIKNTYDVKKMIDAMDSIIMNFIGIKTEEKIKEVQDKIKECENKKENDEALLVLAGDPHSSLIHCKPVIMKFNQNEQTIINEWDGNKLTIDEDRGTILTPMLGAGYKENNQFTGIILGTRVDVKDDGTKDGDRRVGLFGYHQGKQSIFLSALDGSALFGVAGESQIYIDPNPENGGYIRSGNYNSDTFGQGSEGTMIQLKDGKIHFGNGNESFIYSGTHNKMSSNDSGFYLGSNGISISKYAKIWGKDHIEGNEKIYFILGDYDSGSYIKFYETYDGFQRKVHLRIGDKAIVNANTISADALLSSPEIRGGTIDGATITGGNISANYIWAPKYNSFDNATFSVDSTGEVKAKQIKIYGNDALLSASQIGCDQNGNGGWRILPNKIVGLMLNPTPGSASDDYVNGIELRSNACQIGFYDHSDSTTQGKARVWLGGYGKNVIAVTNEPTNEGKTDAQITLARFASRDIRIGLHPTSNWYSSNSYATENMIIINKNGIYKKLDNTDVWINQSGWKNHWTKLFSFETGTDAD